MAPRQGRARGDFHRIDEICGKPTRGCRENCEKGEGAKWAHSAYLVREVHLVNVEPKVGRGEKAKPMDNLCEGVKNNEENTMV